MISDSDSFSDPAHHEHDYASAILTIDKAAIRRNYRQLQSAAGNAICSAVVKADAYGMGVEQIVPLLCAEGCRHFFVAQIEEAMTLRKIAPQATIYVLNGLIGPDADLFVEHNFIPVLKDISQMVFWAQEAKGVGRKLPMSLYIDTGMNRLGIRPHQIDEIPAHCFEDLSLELIMSHLASANERNNPSNEKQLAAFKACLTKLPKAPASFANTSGIYLGADYHFDMVRPGAGLYGFAPIDDEANPFAPVLKLSARLLQIRDVPEGEMIGYMGSFTTKRASRIGTLAIGYADGLPSHLGNRGFAFIGEYPAPIVGRLSMDLTTIDLTDLPENLYQSGMMVDLLNKDYTVNELTEKAETIGYSVLTSLNQRSKRIYCDE